MAVVTKMSEKQTTTITVNRQNRDRLAKLGTKDSTFDDIIGQLLGETELASKLERALGKNKRLFKVEVSECQKTRNTLKNSLKTN